MIQTLCIVTTSFYFLFDGKEIERLISKLLLKQSKTWDGNIRHFPFLNQTKRKKGLDLHLLMQTGGIFKAQAPLMSQLKMRFL
jgi:hypothetical protein